MHLVIAPDKFKGSLSSAEAAKAMEAGARRAKPDARIDICPMADGGEGTVSALVAATGGRFVTRTVTGPLPDMKVQARFGILGDGKTAVIEMAAASGLSLLSVEDRDPMRTTTFGTGELLLAAVELGMTGIILGIGGSATIEWGHWMQQACGLPVILEGGEPVSFGEPLTGGDIERVVLIKHGRGSAIEKVRITMACDVTNPLYGENGAAKIYGPQKGATAEQIAKLDADLKELARRTGKIAEANSPGAGAAGGLGFALQAFCGAELKRGVDIVMEAVKLRERLVGADLCFTGEGRLDRSSLSGKVVSGVGGACRELGVPCIAIAGTVESGVDYLEAGIVAEAISDGAITFEQSIREAGSLVARRAEILLRNWK